MKPELLKDILITLIIMSNTSFFLQWSVIYPYLGSYYKYFDPSITLKGIFSCILVLYFGMFLGNLILPRFFYFFGLRKTLQIGSLFYFINLTCLYSFISMWGFCINILITGALVNFSYFTISVFFSQKYENGILYCPIVFMGVSIGAMIWPLVINVVINPDNHSMDVSSNLNGYRENYYAYSVSKRVVHYLNFHGLFALVVNGFLCQFLTDPQNHQGVLSLYLKSWWGSNAKGQDKNEDYNIVKKNIEERLSENIRESIQKSRELLDHYRQSIDASKNHDLEHELLEKKDNATETSKPLSGDVDKYKEAVSPRFLFLLLVSTVRASAVVYFSNNCKYIGNLFIKDDNLISTLISLTSALEIIFRMTGSYFWLKLEFFKTMYVLLASSIVFNLMFMYLFPLNLYSFAFLLIICRILYGVNAAVTHITLFSLYPSETAIYLYKIFDNTTLAGLVYAVFLNYFFVWDDNYVPIFVIFVIIEFISFAVLIFKLRTAYK